MRIVVTELIWPAGLETLQAGGPVLYDPKLWQDRPRLKAALEDCLGLVVRNQTLVDADLLAHAPALKVVGRLGVGLDNLDVPALQARGIVVVTGGNAGAVAVAEYTLGAMLALSRMLPAADASTKAGGWERQRFTGNELRGKTLGLVGYGEIGRQVALRAAAFGMRLLAFDPVLSATHATLVERGVELVPMATLLAESDVVSLHVPLLLTTRNLIDAAALARMKPSALLVNSSRGGVVEEEALAVALAEGRLAGAALDVRSREPAGGNDPLALLPNVLLTPHIAGLTQESQHEISVRVAGDVVRVLRGEAPRWPVP